MSLSDLATFATAVLIVAAFVATEAALALAGDRMPGPLIALPLTGMVLAAPAAIVALMLLLDWNERRS